MRAVILAAGEGTRLRPHTLDRPKCLVSLAGATLLTHQQRALERARVTDVTVVTGYRADMIDALGVRTVHNPRFASTNMVASLMCAASLLDGSDDVLVAYGDIVYEPRVVEALAATVDPLAVTVDRAWRRLWELRMDDPLRDAETLRLDEEGYILELGKVPAGYDDIAGQYMGLIGVKAPVAAALVDAYTSLAPDGPYDGRDRDNMFMTSFLQHLIDRGQRVGAVVVDGGWLEVDTVDDLQTYDALAADDRLAEYCALEPGGR